MSDLKDNKANQLSDAELDQVSGGYIFYAGMVQGANQDFPWEVINDTTGEVVQRFRSRGEAERYAYDTWNDTREIGWGGLQDIRARWDNRR